MAEKLEHFEPGEPVYAAQLNVFVDRINDLIENKQDKRKAASSK